LYLARPVFLIVAEKGALPVPTILWSERIVPVVIVVALRADRTACRPERPARQ
jgi:hypothetical protein